MTNKNLNLSNAQDNNSIVKPFMLKPAAKDYLWGGNRLNDDFSKNIPLSPLAETWECSTHKDGHSIIANGEYKGSTLQELIKLYPQILGTHCAEFAKQGELPILIKFIDAKKDLSVQVHPSDEYAFENENGSLGKSEMWYVLDAAKNAKLVYGFRSDMNKELLRKSIEKNTIGKYLQKVKIHKDDVFYIESGTVHAIGAGALIAEIQENSNLTYRLYDYDRVDKNGCKRELHIDKALDVANMQKSSEPKQPMRVLKYRNGWASELLSRCKYFQVDRILVNTERYRHMADFCSDSTSFRVLLCTNGCGVLFFGDNESMPFFKGDCIFVPANSVEIKIHGKAQFLDVRC